MNPDWIVRPAIPEDFFKIQDICVKVYPFTKPWNLDQFKKTPAIDRFVRTIMGKFTRRRTVRLYRSHSQGYERRL